MYKNNTINVKFKVNSYKYNFCPSRSIPHKNIELIPKIYYSIIIER